MPHDYLLSGNFFVLYLIQEGNYVINFHTHTFTHTKLDTDTDCLLITYLVHHLIDNKVTLEEPQLSRTQFQS